MFIFYVIGVQQSEDPTKLQVAVAKLVTSLPTHVSKEEYFAALCPQVVSLVRFAIDAGDLVLLRVLCMIVARISFIAPDACAASVLIPVLGPLLVFSPTGASKKGIETMAFSEATLRHAVGALHGLLTLCPPPPFLLTVLHDVNALQSSLVVYMKLSERLQSISELPEDASSPVISVAQALQKALWEINMVTFSHSSVVDTAKWLYEFVLTEPNDSVGSSLTYDFVFHPDR